MKFEWDTVKAESNARKHRVTFMLAITVFDDPYALIATDTEHSAAETREWIIGESDRGVLVVVFTQRGIAATKEDRNQKKVQIPRRRLLGMTATGEVVIPRNAGSALSRLTMTKSSRAERNFGITSTEARRSRIPDHKCTPRQSAGKETV